MNRLFVAGVACISLLVFPAIIWGDPGLPPVQVNPQAQRPSIQTPEIRPEDYPRYCDTLTAWDQPRMLPECFAWFRFSGFRIGLHRKAVRDQQVAFIGQVMDVVRGELTRMSLRVPAAALDKLRGTAIVLTDLELCGNPNWVGCYQQGPDIYQIRLSPTNNGITYLDYATTQSVLMHELAHAFHAKHLPGGYENQCVKDLFLAAKVEGKHDEVAYHHPANNPAEHSRLWHGKPYALTNEQEFFAEMSMTYYMMGAYEPYNRSMLIEWDHATALAIQEIWEGKRCNKESASTDF